MGIPVVLPGLPPPDTNMDSRIILGGVDLSQPIVTPFGVVRCTGQKLEGWSGGTASTGDGTQRAYRPGAVPSLYPQSKPRVMTLSMLLQAESPAAMREAWDVLNVAAAKTDQTLIRDQWGLRRRCTVRRQGDIAETLYPSAWVKGWSCQLKAFDPRKYGDQTSVVTGLPFVTGGLVAPVTGPLTSVARTDTGIASLRNDGTEQAPVRLRIDGPVLAPKVTRVGSAGALVFASSYLLPAGNWLDVDMERRSVLENGVADRAQYVVSRGFFAAERGRNDYVFQADSYDPAAKLSVTTASAWE